MKRTSRLANLRGPGVLVFTFAVLALVAVPASAVAVPGTYTVKALVSNNGVPGTTVGARLQKAWGPVARPRAPWGGADNSGGFFAVHHSTRVQKKPQLGLERA